MFTNTVQLLATSGERGFWMPSQSSTVAPMVDHVFDVITWISIFFFVLIMALMFYFMWRYRRTSHVPTASGPTHHTPLELTWSVIPLILVIAIFYIGMKGFIQLRQVPTGAYEVYVTAQKWNWSFQHRNGAQDMVLDVPAGRPVKLVMASSDVLHSLFIPAFRVKEDVVPGRYRTMWFEVPDNGERRQFDLYCTEYCGTQHSQMITRVNVIPEVEWEDYITEKANIIKELADDQLPCYAATRIFPRCSSCHSLDGSNLTGPSFQGLWERVASGETVFTDGSTLSALTGDGKDYASPEDYIIQSILNPQKHIREGYAGAMPSFQGQLKQREIDAMIMFLKDPYAIVDEKGNLKVECNF